MMPGVGNHTAKRLISFCGGLEGVYHRSSAALRQIPGIGPILSKSVAKGKVLIKAEKELNFARNNGIRVLCYLDEAYPSRLRQCIDGPLILFSKGDGKLNPERAVAVVGTRNATDYGKRVTREIIRDLAGNVGQIVSGLAYGIDAEAHKASLESHIPTVAVLAHGLDRIYPALHRKLAYQMLDDGALISEFRSGSLPDRENFPKRNRIIAGLSDAVLVVEAAEKGGALITADLADGYHRDVFAVPGRCDDLMSKGCLKLIRTNRAALVENASDILYSMRWDHTERRHQKKSMLFPLLDPETEILWNLLKEACSMDMLVEKSGLPQGKISALLLGLELDGWIQLMAGNRWIRQ